MNDKTNNPSPNGQSNAVAPVKQSEITDTVLTRVNEMQQSGGLHLPKDYSAPNALKSAFLLMQDMDLSKYSQTSIANSLLSMVVQGLNPDKKQCYFIGYGQKLQLQRSYQGNIAIAKRVANVKTVKAALVYAEDVFEYGVDTSTGKYSINKHETKLSNIDDNKIIGAYCIVTFNDGAIDIEIMTIAQVRKAWMQGAAKGNSGAHQNFTGEMAKKSVINRALKTYINSSDDSAVYEEIDEPTDTVQAAVKQDVKNEANGPVIDIELEEVKEPAESKTDPQGNQKPSFA